MPRPANLDAFDDEMDLLVSRFGTGETNPPALTLRSRFGSLIKRRLYRFLWWQTHQIQGLMALIARRDRESTSVLHELSQRMDVLNQQIEQTRQGVEAVSQRIGRVPQQLQETHHVVFECRRQLRETESRLQQLISEQATVQREQFNEEVKLAENRITETVLHETATSLEEIRTLTRRIDITAEQEEEVKARLAELAQRVDVETTQQEQFSARLSDLGLFTHHTRAAVSIQERRLTLFLEEARRGLSQPLTAQLREMIDHDSAHKYDSLYMAFEDVFRGSREDIKARQSVYLLILNEHGVGSSTLPIVDLGCGRGEWLELLREHDLHAVGVDSNEAMIEQCKSAGVEVVQGEALAHLRSLPDASVGAITCFHMVEHLPFDLVLALVDEALRVLKSGGIFIVETPNPENILVGANTFYLDPTHLKPLPSPMLRFFIEARGFCNVEVRELHPYPEAVRFPEDRAGVGKRLNDYLYGSQDYAVIGRKP